MKLSNELYWNEGLFIQPQHFQIMQRNIINETAGLRNLINRYQYGIIKEQIITHKLEDEGIIDFIELQVIMRNGLELDIKQNAIIKSKNLNKLRLENCKELQVYVAVPSLNFNRPNIKKKGDNTNSRRFSIAEEEFYDENTGDNPKKIFVRKYNICCLVDGEDMDGYDTIPLVKIKKKIRENKKIWTIDQDYIPPCLYLNSSKKLENFVNKLFSKVNVHTKNDRELIHNNISFQTGSVKLQRSILKLYSLNIALAEIKILEYRQDVSPIEVFSLIYKLISVLYTIIPIPDEIDKLEYKHDNLLYSLQELEKILFILLNEKLIHDSYFKVQFSEVDENIYKAVLSEKHFTDTDDFYLCIRSKSEKDILIDMIENENGFKIMPFNEIYGKALPGFKLVLQNLPPEDFPKYNDGYYFYIKQNNSESLWKQLLDDMEMGIFMKKNEKISINSMDIFTRIKNTAKNI